MPKAIGVDLGGTKTTFVLIDEYGNVLKRKKYKTPKEKEKILEMLVKGVKEIKNKEKVVGIGFGLAGFIDSNTGVMHFSPNVPAINNTNFRRFLKKHFKERIVFENDANCFAIAEHIIGYKGKYKNVVAITLGTGIGSGLIIEGKLAKGRGHAAELGHMIIDHSSAKVCDCGNIGCFEELADGKALLRRAKKLGLKVKNNEELAKLAERGNKKALQAIKDTASYLAVGLANIINIFDPEAIIVGGGLANIDILLKEAKKELRKYTLVRKSTPILKAKLGDYGPAIGAAMLAFKEFVWMKKQPKIAVDIIIEYYKRRVFEGIILIKRKFKPKGWALPGGLVEYGETLEKAAKREALEETGLKIRNIRQFKAYSDPKRDERGHSISIVFIAKASGNIKPGSDALYAEVFRPENLPKKLCFDHKKIIDDWLKEKLRER